VRLGHLYRRDLDSRLGARFADMGVGYGNYAIEKLLAMTGQPLKVVSRVLRDECEALRLRGQL
jgi:hypothetical protein